MTLTAVKWVAIWLFGLSALAVIPRFARPDGRVSANTNDVPPVASGFGFPLLTYFGGSESDSAACVATDSLGNVYIAGTTYSENLWVTADAFQTTNEGGSDGFVTKLSPAGSLVYSTYLGGKGDDAIYALAVDTLGNAYITGRTESKNFPSSDTTIEQKHSYFAAKLNATGTGLIYSTRRLGGQTIAVDVSGNAYVAGGTNEIDFPTTPGAFQTNFGGGQVDAFVAKLDASGEAIVYCTYLGGGRDEYISAITVDREGNAYVAGNFVYSSYTGQKPFPTTPGAYLESAPQHPASFVTKINSTGSGLVYSTYIEASTVSGIAIDSEGSAYLTGDATFVAATDNAVQRSSGGVCCYYFSQFYNGGGDAFVMKLNRLGSALVYATYLGGSNYDAGRSISIDSSGNAHVVGFTDSLDFELANPFQIGNRGVVRTSDTGSEWNAVSNGLKAGDVRTLVIDPKNVSTLYAGSQIGVFKSTDGGGSWKEINVGLTKSNASAPYPAYGVHSLVIDPVSSSTLFAVLDSGLFKSIDGGNSWTFLRFGVNGIAFDPDSQSTIYAATRTVSTSTDGGITWSDLNLGETGPINWVNKVVIASTSPPTIFADLSLQTVDLDSIGIVKSTNGGATWRKVGRGPTGLGPFGSSPNSSVPLVTDPRIPSTVYSGSLKSTDSGETWSALNFTNGFINALAVDPMTPSTLYAGAGQYQNAGIYKSTDGGASWRLTQFNGAPIYSIAIDSRNPPVVYAGTGISRDAFLTKIDPSGSLILSSTVLGGFGNDAANGVAVDSFGNVYITGATDSMSLPAANALQPMYGGSGDAFVAMTSSPRSLNPRITGASIDRKTLIVSGEDFDFGAVLLIDGKVQGRTENDQNNPTTRLTARKSAKSVPKGHTVILQVRNPHSTLSPEFTFARP